MKIRKILSLVLALAMTASMVAGCGGSESSSAASPAADTASPAGSTAAAADPYEGLPEVKWRMSHTQAPENYMNIAYENFAQYVSDKTGGKFSIEIFHSGTLGSEQEVIENMQMGTIAGNLGAVNLLANFVPCYDLYSIPGLFSDIDEFSAVMNDEEIMGKMREAAAAQGILDYGYYQNYFRQLYTKEEVKNLEDFESQKIRVMGSEILVNTFQALGCNPTTTAWSELYSAIQLGVCDGLDHVATSVRANAFNEVLGYVCEPNLFVTPMFVLISKPMYDDLPEAYQQLLDEAINEVLLPELREKADAANAQDLEWLTTEGGLTYVDCDVEAIHEAVADVRTQYIGTLEDWVQEIANQILAE